MYPLFLQIFFVGCLSSFPPAPQKQIIDLPSEDYDGDQYSENEGDSDDNDATIYPNAPEICDGKDNDQNGFVDDDQDYHNEYYTDFDQDGFGDLCDDDADGDGFKDVAAFQGTGCDQSKRSTITQLTSLLLFILSFIWIRRPQLFDR